MRIAILTPTLHAYSGIDRLVQRQATELRKKGHQVGIFALEASIKVAGVKVHMLGMPRADFLQRFYRLFMFFDVGKIEKAAKEVAGFDWVISHFYPMNLIARKAKRINPKLRYTYHNAGVGIASTYSLAEQLYLRLFNRFTNKSLAGCDDAVSISAFLARQLEKETGIKSAVEHVPVDAGRVRRASAKRAKARHRIGKGSVLLYVGRVSPHKGIHLLIEAFRMVRKKHPGTELLIVGKETFPSYSRKLREGLPRGVRFLGTLSDQEVYDLYAACDCYVTASLWEGFDIPLVEANAAGKPAVAFEVGAHPEVLRKGRLVPEGDVEAFADAVVKVLK